MTHKKETLINKSSCVRCGVLVVPADNGRIYGYTPAAASTLIDFGEGYKYITGLRPSVHHCDQTEMEAAARLLHENLFKNKTIIQLYNDRYSDEKHCWPYSVACPKCAAPVNQKCNDLSKTGKINKRQNAHVHPERNYRGAEVHGYEITWHRNFGRIMLRKGAYLP